MATDYDRIAEDYRACKLAPWRRHIEAFTLMALLGDLKGKRVMDLACGDGIYSRTCRRLGAAEVVGVDLSPRMIELAREQEQRESLGVTYHCGDAADIELGEQFDLVLTAYLFNYAKTADQLLAMARAAARHVRPGGRLVAVNNNPTQSIDRFKATEGFGMVKAASNHPLREGDAITYTIRLDDGHSFSFDNYYLTPATHERALAEAGFTAVSWRPCQLDPAASGQADWRMFLDDPPVIFIEAHRQT